MTRFCPEFQLMAACCRWPDDARRVDAIAQAASVPIDWERFVRLVRRHRAVALVTHGLRHLPQVPEHVRQSFLDGARQQAADALRLAAECLRLQSLFDAAGIPISVVKGVPLAIRTYGDASLKQSRDIDLVIPPEHLEAGWRLMQQAGYRRTHGHPDPTPEEMDLVLSFAKDLEFRHATGGIYAELHYRLVRNRHVLPGLRTDERIMPVAGATLRTMGDEAYYAYLCVHAAAHAIGRLKWLADIAALVSVTGDDIVALHAHAAERGAARASLLILLLCHELLGLDVPSGLLAQARSSLVVRLLAANARAALADERWDEMRDTRLVRERVAQLFLQGGRAFWVELGMLWASESDRRALRLPPSLHWAYGFVRVPSWMWRMGRKVVGRIRV